MRELARAPATRRRPTPRPCHSSTTSKAISASGASASRTNRARPIARPLSDVERRRPPRGRSSRRRRAASRSRAGSRGLAPRKRRRRERVREAVEDLEHRLALAGAQAVEGRLRPSSEDADRGGAGPFGHSGRPQVRTTEPGYEAPSRSAPRRAARRPRPRARPRRRARAPASRASLEQRAVGAQAREAQVGEARLPRRRAAAPSPRSSRSLLRELEAVGRVDERLEPRLRAVRQLVLRAARRAGSTTARRRARRGRAAGGAARARSGRPPGRS